MITRMPLCRRAFWYLAILAAVIELGFDLFISLWGLSHALQGETWGWTPGLIGALRGALFAIAFRYAICGYNWARIAIVVFDSIQGVLGFGMSFVALAMNNAGHGVRSFLIVLSVSVFFGASALVVGIGVKPIVTV
jgi:hypothetical protein